MMRCAEPIDSHRFKPFNVQKSDQATARGDLDPSVRLLSAKSTGMEETRDVMFYKGARQVPARKLQGNMMEHA